jgi:hypothetical protein
MENKKDVHTEHCCILHGCKYGDDRFGGEGCSVCTLGYEQSYVCEDCDNDGIDSLEKLKREYLIFKPKQELKFLEQKLFDLNHKVKLGEVSYVEIGKEHSDIYNRISIILKEIVEDFNHYSIIKINNRNYMCRDGFMTLVPYYDADVYYRGLDNQYYINQLER